MLRREFIRTTSSCCGHVLGLAAFAPTMMRNVFASQDDESIVAKEKWGQLRKVQDGVWALISTPFESQDFTTVCNGGIIAGDKGVLAVEGFMQTSGAKWLAEQAKRLTGKMPTDIVCTHYHRDHTSGISGYFTKDHRPNVWLTESTEAAAIKSSQASNPDFKIENVQRLNAKQATTVDLGNRKVNIIPRSGHTASDVTIELVDPKIIWCGDLYFNRMFPNYSDAIPNRLNAYVNELLKLKEAQLVPGHGPIAGRKDVLFYQKFLNFVEESAKAGFKSGKPAEETAKEFKLPEELKSWLVWSPDVVKRSYVAWYKHFESTKQGSDTKGSGSK